MTDKENILREARAKMTPYLQGKLIQMTVDFSPETLEARKWHNVLQMPREKNCWARILYTELWECGEMETFSGEGNEQNVLPEDRS